MKNVMRVFLFVLAFALSAMAMAADVRFNGVKPAVIVDVRTPEEFAAGHVDGAVNIPYDQISHGIASIKGLKKESPILLYCRSGRRSAIARTALEQQGFKQVMDGGGMSSLVHNLKICTASTC